MVFAARGDPPVCRPPLFFSCPHFIKLKLNYLRENREQENRLENNQNLGGCKYMRRLRYTDHSYLKLTACDGKQYFIRNLLNIFTP